MLKTLKSITIEQPDFEVYSGPAAWTHRPISTSVFKYDELDVTLPRDNKYAKRPAVDLDLYFDDDESVRHADVVTWISCGVWHIPVIEDFPQTVPIGNALGFLAKTANLWPEDTSMNLRNALGGTAQDVGTCAVVRLSMEDILKQ
eukprot:Selendium_serpulae@DN5829_c0_g1_i2.p2